MNTGESLITFFKKLGLLLFTVLAWLSVTPGLLADAKALNLQNLPSDKAILLGHLVSIFEPSDATLTDEDILNGNLDPHFYPSQQALIGLGFASGATWLRFEIENASEEIKEITLESRYPMLDQVTLFQKTKSNLFQADTQGDSLDSRSMRADIRFPVFTINAQPGKNVYYLKVVTNGSKILALYLSWPDVHKRHILFDTAVTCVFFGVLLTLLLYNTFLTLSFRSQTYLYYSMFLFSMICVHLSMQGVWPVLLEGDLAIWAQNRGFAVFSATAMLVSTLMTMKFLNSRDHMPRTHKIYSYFMIANYISLPISLFTNYNSAVRILAVLLFLCTVVMLTTCILASLRGYRPAFFYGFAWLFAAVANILMVLVYQGIAEIPQLVQWGILPGTVCEGILMSLALGDRVNFTRAKSDQIIKNLNLELQNHLTEVEAIVTDRTDTIRSIIDNVASGFLMFDAEFRIAPGFTRSCHQLLGLELQAGQDLLTALELSPKQRTFWRMAICQIFQDELPLEVSLSQIPLHVSVHGKHLELHAAGIRSKEGVLQNLLLTITDATKLRQKTLESKRNRNLIKMMRNIEEFRQFIAYSFQSVEKLKSQLQHQDALFILHSLKGNCLVFHLADIADFIHKLEDKSQVTPADGDDLEKLFQHFLTRHARLLRTPWGILKQEHMVNEGLLSRLKEISQTRNLSVIQQDIDLWIDEVSARLIRSAIQPLLINARVVAKKLNKSLDLQVIDGEARVRSLAEQMVLDELLHLVRNSIIHGIEDDREAAQKPKSGLIRLEFRESSAGLAIICSDDGRGFDRSTWEREYATRCVSTMTAVGELSLSELVRKVSQSGFSTEKDISMFAGRGVGIGAVFAAIESCGGTVSITSELGRGTCFEIFIPRDQSIRHAS